MDIQRKIQAGSLAAGDLGLLLAIGCNGKADIRHFALHQAG